MYIVLYMNVLEGEEEEERRGGSWRSYPATHHFFPALLSMGNTVGVKSIDQHFDAMYLTNKKELTKDQYISVYIAISTLVFLYSLFLCFYSSSSCL